MSTTIETARPKWDLSHVLDFVNTLTPNHDVASDHHNDAFDVRHTIQDSGLQDDDSIGLGDFSRVWQFLGTSKHTSDLPEAPSKDDYASDGAIHKRLAPPKRAPSIGTDGEDLTASASDTPAYTKTQTKTQRKRARRKERKAAEEAKRIQQATVSESEADYPGKATPARKASAHVALAKFTASQLTSKVTHDVKQKREEAARSAAVQPLHNQTASGDGKNIPTVSRYEECKQITDSREGKVSDSEAASAVAKAIAALKATQFVDPSTPSPKPRYNLRSSNTAVQFTPSSLQPPAKTLPQLSGKQPTTPSPAAPLLNGKPVTGLAVPPPATPFSTPNTFSQGGRKPQPVIGPAIVRSGEDRQWALLLKIMHNFSEDRKYLVKPMNMTTHNNDPKGIHVFVDASNIFIGFMDQLKRSRGIHQMVKVPQVEPSFDALALLMERRRPIARRVLAGSTPHIAAFDVAKAVGYECNILEKVLKARELTQRQIYFKNLDAMRFGKTPKRAPPSNNVVIPSPAGRFGEAGGSGSGSETNTPQYAPPKMVEQGVDEILHMKILESIVDYEEPSTIVLASGDAAAAEYSDGFQAMANRALQKGWKVELVSWSKNINGEYKRQAWTQAWGDQFKIIYLDDYAEELLDM